MTKQPNHTDAAASGSVERFRRRLVRRARLRTVGAIVLVGLGGILLYSGLSSSEHVSTTFGFIFILYGLFMRFHIRRTAKIIAEFHEELHRLRDELDEQQTDDNT